MPMRQEALAGADRAALCAEVARDLEAGRLWVLPTETVYGLAMLPTRADAAARARALATTRGEQPFTWHVRSADDLERLRAVVPPAAARLVARYWPGPLTLLLATHDGGRIGVRAPANDFTRAVIDACGGALWMTSVDDEHGKPMTEPQQIAAALQDRVEGLVDAGPSPLGTPSTLVRVDEHGIGVLREGILSAEEVLATAADLVLFVCTGNTCRSPLAEALARHGTAEALGIEPTQLASHGFAFASAGTGTAPGWPASDGSLAAGQEVGLDLSAHQSQPVDPALCRRARHIYCLADSHRRALLADFPEFADKVRLLRPDALDIADPFGGDLRTYRRARDEIRAAVEARLRDWLPR